MLDSYSVFALSDLEDLELLSARAKRHLSRDLVLDALGVGERPAILPIGTQSCNEFAPVDHSIPVVKLVGHGVHLQTG